MNKFPIIKKWRYPIGISVVLLIALYWAVFSRISYKPVEAIPAQTAVMVNFKHAAQAVKLELLVDSNSIGNLSIFKMLQSDLKQVIQLFPSEVVGSMRAQSMVAGFSLQPSDSLHPVLIFDTGNRSFSSNVPQLLSTVEKWFVSNFKGHEIYSLYRQNSQPLVLAVRRNLLIVSRYSFLVEDALLQLDNPDRWWINQNWVPNARCQIGIRPEVLEERIQTKFKHEWQFLPKWVARQVSGLNLFYTEGGWEVSVILKEAIDFGISGSAKFEELASILPDNTTLGSQIALAEPGSILEIFADKPGTKDFERHMLPWIGPELGFAINEPYSPNLREDQFIVFSIRNEELADQHLKKFGDQTGLIKSYDYQTYEIRQFLSQSLLAPLTSGKDKTFANPAFTKINGFVVFASSPSALELLIDKYIVNQTLANAPDFLLLKKDTPAEGSLRVYFNFEHLPLLLKQLLQGTEFAQIQNDIEQVSKTGLFTSSLLSTKQKSLTGRLISRRQTVKSSQVGILWKTQLSGNAITRPYIIANESDGRETFILIQDDLKQLYCLNSSGTVLWQKQLDYPIQSAIQSIDYYKNGQSCFLFNTADAIWVVNESGESIAGFPFKLQSPATNGITVVDFDANQQYTLFIACQNGNLYGFDQFGRPLPRWNPKTGVGRIKHPMVHFKHGNKDYLAVLSLSGQLSVFNRDGTPHFDAKQFEGSFFVSPPQFDTDPKAPRIVSVNTLGRAYVCNLSGETFAMDLSTTNPKSEACFVFESFCGDSRKDYAIQQGSQLSISMYENKSFVEGVVKVPFQQSPDTCFYAGCCEKLGLLDRKKNQVLLIDAKGEHHPGFPLAGSTPFIIYPINSGAHSYIMVVGNKNTVCAYALQ